MQRPYISVMQKCLECTPAPSPCFSRHLQHVADLRAAWDSAVEWDAQNHTQTYVESQEECVRRSQDPGAEHGKAHVDGNGASEQQEAATSVAEGQKRRREILSHLVSKVQSNAASLAEPLLDTGTAHVKASSSVHVPALPATYIVVFVITCSPVCASFCCKADGSHMQLVGIVAVLFVCDFHLTFVLPSRIYPQIGMQVCWMSEQPFLRFLRTHLQLRPQLLCGRPL